MSLTVLGGALRFATIGQQSYWYDESVTADLVGGSFGDLLRGVVDSESTPPVYYVLAWIWAQVLGTDESQLRALSALAGTLVVPVAFAAGRVVATTRVGVAAAAIAATSPMLIWYAQEARAYALLTLLAGSSFVLFALARSDPSPRRLRWWAVVSALAISTHYFAAFVVLAEAALLLRAHRHARPVRRAVAGLAGVAVLLSPLAAIQASHRRLGWVGGIDLTERVTEAIQRLVGAGQPSSWWGATGAEVTPHVWLVAVAVFALSAVLVATRSTVVERAGAVLALQVAAAGIGLPIAMALAADLVSGGDGDYFLDRNVLGAWVPLAVFVATGLVSCRAGVLGIACLAAVLGWNIAVYVNIATTPKLQRDDWRAVADALPDDSRAVIVVYPAYQAAALARQRPELAEFEDALVTDTVVLVLTGFELPPKTFRVPAGFEEARRSRVQHFVLLEYRGDAGPVGPRELATGPPGDADLQPLAWRSRAP